MTQEHPEIITREIFTIWKNDPVTAFMFSQLQRLRESIEAGLKDETIILSDGGQLKLARLLGQRDGLDTVLNMSYEDEVGDEN